jgi:hypothetical protein
MAKNAWCNIVISSDDPEIVEIDEFEKSLGTMPSNVKQIRELITRFEVCHFKYLQHIKHIKESIMSLKPTVNPKTIGIAHIRYGEKAWRKDKTGRSLIGQKYVWALTRWLGDSPKVENNAHYDKNLGQKVDNWLGEKNQEKEGLVRLLIARLTWEGESADEALEQFEKLMRRGKYEELENQILRTDICHYLFSKNLDLLLQGIGHRKPVKEFEGCGSFNSDIRENIEKEFSVLDEMLETINSKDKQSKNELIKEWLIACLAKTMKEQVGLKRSTGIIKKIQSK